MERVFLYKMISQEFKKFLNESNMKEENKDRMKFLIELVKDNKASELTSRSYLLEGDPGIGKTYFAERFVQEFNLPIFFIGPFKFQGKSSVSFDSFKELTKEIMKVKEGIILLDDLNTTLKFEENELDVEEKKLFMNLLEHIKRTNGNLFLFVTANETYMIDDSIIDRMEVRIDFDLPSEQNKKNFLMNKYASYLKRTDINYVSEMSFGYNFRDLDELIRLSYSYGSGKINRKSILKALKDYSPTNLHGCTIIRDPEIRFKDIIGNDILKKELSYLKSYIKKPHMFKKLGIKRSNMLMFYGEPGTGKTFMAKALAGELKIPIININTRDIFPMGDGVMGLGRLFRKAKRFRNCVIVLDEFDKVLGRGMMEEDNMLIGELERELDGLGAETQSIMVFIMNNKLRFGSAFHDRVKGFSFGLPENEHRKNFFEQKLNKSHLSISSETFEDLINHTEKFSYRQLESLWNNLIFKLLEKDINFSGNRPVVNESQFKETVASLLSLATPQVKNLSFIG